MSHPQPAVLSAAEAEEWQPHTPEEFQEVRTVGRIAIGLLGVSTITHLLSTWSDWNTHSVVQRFLSGAAEIEVDAQDLNRADSLARLTSIPNVIVSVAAAVVFVIWLWRSRVNSEVLCQADHRHSHGWVLASWFCPGPNLWYPKQIVDDVWRASDPRTPVWSDDLRRLRKPLLTSVWWCTWVGALAFDVVIRRVLMWMDPTVSTLRGIALAGTASLVLTAISAVAAALVIRKITKMQTSREWIPWWDQREPQLSAVKTSGRTAERSRPQPDRDPEATMVAPPLRLERQPDPRYAGAGAQSEQQQAAAAQTARLSAVPSQAALLGSGGGSPLGSGGGSPLAPAAGLSSPYAGDTDGPRGWPSGPEAKEEPAPSWSPFAPVAPVAPVAGGWQDPADAAPETQQFSPYEAWSETGPVKEAAASLRPSTDSEPPRPPQPTQPTWSSAESRYGATDDLLSTPRPSWQAETVAPPSLSVVPPIPAEPEVPSWRKSFDEEHRPGQGAAAYLPPSAPTSPAEPAPARRPARRAAEVAVDSPSAARPQQSPPDDYLTPSKPLPPVPSFGPEPAYDPGPDYNRQPDYRTEQVYSSEPTYHSEPASRPEPTYQAPHAPEPPYPGESAYAPEPTYSPDPYGSRAGHQSEAEPGYITPEQPYSSPEPTYRPAQDDQPAPNYEPRPAYRSDPSHQPEPTYGAEPTYEPEPMYRSEPTYQPEPTYRSEPSYQPEPDYRPEQTQPPEPRRYSPEPTTDYGSGPGYSTHQSHSSSPVRSDQYGQPSPYESAYSPEPSAPRIEPEPTYTRPEPTYGQQPAHRPEPTYGPDYQAYTPTPPSTPEPTYDSYSAPRPAESQPSEPQFPAGQFAPGQFPAGQFPAGRSAAGQSPGQFPAAHPPEPHTPGPQTPEAQPPAPQVPAQPWARQRQVPESGSPEPRPEAEPPSTAPSAPDPRSAANGRDATDTTAPRTHPRRRWV